jgi:hypothetical protein
LHRLALLQAFETARLDRRAVDKNIFAILAADKAVAYCKPSNREPIVEEMVRRLGTNRI